MTYQSIIMVRTGILLFNAFVVGFCLGQEQLLPAFLTAVIGIWYFVKRFVPTVRG